METRSHIREQEMNSDSFYNLPDLIKAIHELAPSDEMTVKAIMKIMGVNLDTITENEEGSRSGQNSKTKPQEEIKKKPSIESPVNVIPGTRRTLKKPSDQSFPSRAGRRSRQSRSRRRNCGRHLTHFMEQV